MNITLTDKYFKFILGFMWLTPSKKLKIKITIII